MIGIKKSSEYRSCNACERGVLNKNGTGLDYPYQFVYEIRFNQMEVALCEQCLEELKNIKI